MLRVGFNLAMPAPPLTHHEILTLIEPFTRRGRRLDLAATSRIDRRLAFVAVKRDPVKRDPVKRDPVNHTGAAPAPPTIRETLQLVSLGTGTFRLTRISTLTSGLQAAVEAMGPKPEELLAQIDALAPHHQFRFGAGFVCAVDYSFHCAGAAPWTMTRGVVQCDGLKLTLTLSPVRRVPADLVLIPAPGGALEVPEDLLAVLGWDWARLIRDKDGWKTKLRLRGGTLKRSRSAEAALDRVAHHLAGTLAEPPGRFHERWVAARWGVVFRRSIPLLTFVALIGAVAFIPRAGVDRGSGLWMLFFQVPTALIALSFCMQELPQYEIPPWPRRSAALRWRRIPAAGDPIAVVPAEPAHDQ
jgi:hypothetical protein